MVAVRCNLWFEEKAIQCDRGCHGGSVIPQEGEESVPLCGIPQEARMCPREDRQAEAQD